jgi:hypothetical protein
MCPSHRATGASDAGVSSSLAFTSITASRAPRAGRLRASPGAVPRARPNRWARGSRTPRERPRLDRIADVLPVAGWPRSRATHERVVRDEIRERRARGRRTRHVVGRIDPQVGRDLLRTAREEHQRDHAIPSSSRFNRRTSPGPSKMSPE